MSRYKQLSDLQALPGRSTTAQDTIKPLKDLKEGGHGLSLFSEMMIAGTAGFDTHGVPGAAAGVASAIGKNKLIAMRAAGMTDVRDLVRGMLLNPALAREALERVGPERVNSRNIRFTQQLNRISAIAAQRMIGPAPKQPTPAAPY